MQNFTEAQRQTHGCFVYQITAEANGADAIAVRSALNVGDEHRTDLCFYKDDLVSVDLIRPSRRSGSNNGPFLRLTDNSGWLFEKKYGGNMARRLPVEKGLWAFYVDKDISLQAHPKSRIIQCADSDTRYLQMQLLHCDRRVVCPSTKIASYRVQGTVGWVCERNESGEILLIPESKVKFGLFAYEVAAGSDISLYNQPSVGLDTQLPVSFGVGDIVACDVVRQSPYGPENGPFLRLHDGWGWVFEQISTMPNCQMRELPIEKGLWTLTVVNSPAGIAMRRHPMDRTDIRTSVVFPPGDTVICDRRIKSSGQTSFYRVKGRDGWVFDLRDENRMMRLISSRSVASEQATAMNGQWSIEYVRGMASAFELKEISLNETSRVISFTSSDESDRINVYYTTRTVGTAINHPSQGQTQMFRRDCSDEELREIMQNPRVHTGKGYKKRSRMSASQGLGRYSYDVDEDQYIDEEDEYRNKLLEYEKEEEKLGHKKLRALKVLKSIDDKRAKDAAEMQSKMDTRAEEFRQIKLQQIEAERQRQRRLAEAERISRSTCSVCHQVFVNEHAKNQHYQAVHCFRCDHCYRDFNSSHALNQHKSATGHW